MKNIKFILIVLILIGTGCKDRPRSNPFDPDTVLDTSQWAPSNLQAEVINDSQIRLSWEQEDNRIDGFRILRKAGSSNYFQIAEITSDSTHYTDTGLSLGVTYTYRVKAFTDVNESGYSNEDIVHFYEDCTGEIEGDAVEDCSGVCNGTAIENECGCVEGNTGLVADFCYGCTDSNCGNYDLDATIDNGECDCMYDIDSNVYQTIQIGN